MKNTKKISLSLIVLCGTHVLHADPTPTPSEVIRLGKLNEAEHKLTKPDMLQEGAMGFVHGALVAGLAGAVANKLVGGDEDFKKCIVAGSGIGAVYGLLSATLNAHYNLNAYRVAQGFDMHAAAARNDVAALKALKAQGHNICAADSRGRTPLMYAAAAGARDAVNFILAESFPQTACFINVPGSKEVRLVQLVPAVDVQDMYGRTAALYAALNNHSDIVKKLAEDHAADLKLKDRDGNSVEQAEEKSSNKSGFFSWFKFW